MNWICFAHQTYSETNRNPETKMWEKNYRQQPWSQMKTKERFYLKAQKRNQKKTKLRNRKRRIVVSNDGAMTREIQVVLAFIAKNFTVIQRLVKSGFCVVVVSVISDDCSMISFIKEQSIACSGKIFSTEVFETTFGVLLASGVLTVSRRRDYWSRNKLKHNQATCISEAISRDRFDSVFSSLHFVLVPIDAAPNRTNSKKSDCFFRNWTRNFFWMLLNATLLQLTSQWWSILVDMAVSSIWKGSQYGFVLKFGHWQHHFAVVFGWNLTQAKPNRQQKNMILEKAETRCITLKKYWIADFQTRNWQDDAAG